MVVDGSGKPAAGPFDIVIEDDEIAQIAAFDAVAAKEGDARRPAKGDVEIDATGKYVMPGIVNTELSSGMTEARGVKNLTPEQVAMEIVGALEVPRFDVFVPRSTGPLLKLAGILPRRAREALARVMKADRVAVSVDASKRAAYESRVAAGAPTADKVAEVPMDSEREAA